MSVRGVLTIGICTLAIACVLLVGATTAKSPAVVGREMADDELSQVVGDVPLQCLSSASCNQGLGVGEWDCGWCSTATIRFICCPLVFTGGMGGCAYGNQPACGSSNAMLGSRSGDLALCNSCSAPGAINIGACQLTHAEGGELCRAGEGL